METTDEKISVSEAQKTLGLARSAFYDRMKFLGITPIKEGRNSFLTVDSLQLLSELGEHINHTGTMEGFGAIEVRSEGELDSQSQEEFSQPNINEGNPEQQFQGILRSAKEHRAGIEIAKYAIASRLSVEDLDPDLIEQIEATRAATLPKSVSAAKTAGAVLEQFMQGRI